MTDETRLKKDIEEGLKLKRIFEEIDWPVFHGSVKAKIRYGKPTLITIERTVKLD